MEAVLDAGLQAYFAHARLLFLSAVMPLMQHMTVISRNCDHKSCQYTQEAPSDLNLDGKPHNAEPFAHLAKDSQAVSTATHQIHQADRIFKDTSRLRAQSFQCAQ